LILHGVVWLLFTGVSGQCIVPFSGSGSWTLKMGMICCPKMSVNNYHMTPHNTPEERRSQDYYSFIQSKSSNRFQLILLSSKLH
jgi:hypothetical protein